MSRVFKYIYLRVIDFILDALIPRISGSYSYNNKKAYHQIFLYLSNENQTYLNPNPIDDSKSKNAPVVEIYEFGCGSGATGSELLRAAKANGILVSRYSGFDSFEGLQNLNDRDKKRWATGSFRYEKDRAEINIKKNASSETEVEIIASQFHELDMICNISTNDWVIHIDCDLYSSTKESLRICRNLIMRGGGIIAFDDYYSGIMKNVPGEKDAFTEFCEDESLDVCFWSPYSQNGALFIVPTQPNIKAL